jgi:hypothetical protein
MLCETYHSIVKELGDIKVLCKIHGTNALGEIAIGDITTTIMFWFTSVKNNVQ